MHTKKELYYFHLGFVGYMLVNFKWISNRMGTFKIIAHFFFFIESKGLINAFLCMHLKKKCFFSYHIIRLSAQNQMQLSHVLGVGAHSITHQINYVISFWFLVDLCNAQVVIITLPWWGLYKNLTCFRYALSNISVLRSKAIHRQQWLCNFF